MRWAGNLLLAFTIIAVAGAAAWFFRYEVLPPTAPTWRLGAVESIIVCTADRWTRDIHCAREEIGRASADAAREMEEWLARRNR
jgi:hypothetical protein